LPGAINIPVRALPTDELQSRIAALEAKPTVAACYDRRSCFMSQVLGLEMVQAGIPFEGRYTTPWDYFIPPAPKPHVAVMKLSEYLKFRTMEQSFLSVVIADKSDD
jgi:hypothetical protein